MSNYHVEIDRLPGIVDVGDTVETSATFTVDGTATDPTTVTLKIQRVSSSDESIYTGTPAAPGAPVVKESTGVFSAELPITDVPGYWTVRWFSDEAAGEHGFSVKDSAFSSPLATS